MKPLIVAEQMRRPVPGGIGTYVKGLLTGLKHMGQDVSLLASRPTGEDRLAPFPFEVTSSRLPSKVLTRAWEHGWVKAPEGFDVVHATSFAYPQTKAPLVVTVHDLAWRAFPDAFPPRGRRWHEDAMNRTIASAKRIVVPSSQVANDLMRAGVAGRLLEVIPHGSDHLPAPDREGASQKLSAGGVDIDQPFLLAVGTLEPRKNLRRLIGAYVSIRDELPSQWPLVIVGKVGWGDELEPAEGVAFVDDADDAQVAALYETCELLAYVPLLEGYGLPVIEAMRVGAPVVASSVPSAGQAAFRVDPMNVAGIAEGILRVATDVALQADLRKRGHDHAARTTWVASAEAHVELWKSIL